MGNLGDEAVLAGLLGELRRQAPDWQVKVLSGNPAATEKQHGVVAVPRASLRSVFRAMREADIVVSGGGGLFQDATSLRSLLYYAGVLHLARLARKRTAILAQSIGPLRTGLARRLTATAAEKADLVTVRDEPSAALLRSIGVRCPVEVTADPAFLVEPDASAAAGPAEMALCLRTWPGGQDAVGAVVEGVGRWLAEEGGTALVLPFQSPQDDAVAGQAAARLGDRARIVPLYGHPGLAAAIMTKVQVVVGARLHALILASSAAVPWVGLAYDPKVQGLASAVGLLALAPEGLTPEGVQAALSALWRERERVRAALLDALPRWKDLARRNVELLLRIGHAEPAAEAARSSERSASAGEDEDA
jgi:polysaccharide pyruvyl transferase CsaB